MDINERNELNKSLEDNVSYTANDAPSAEHNNSLPRFVPIFKKPAEIVLKRKSKEVREENKIKLARYTDAVKNKLTTDTEPNAPHISSTDK